MQRQQWLIRNSLQCYNIASVEEVASVCSENTPLLGHSSYPQPGNGLTDIGPDQKQQPFDWCCCIRCVASFVAVVLVQTYYWCCAIIILLLYIKYNYRLLYIIILYIIVYNYILCTYIDHPSSDVKMHVYTAVHMHAAASLAALLQSNCYKIMLYITHGLQYTWA